MKRLLIIDGNALVHRAFHALPSLRTKKGELVNAVYGFLSIFIKSIEQFSPDYVCACFDLAAPTFRHKEFKDYKATRAKAPDGLYEQIPKIKEILNKFEVPIYEEKGFEADDVIATISKHPRVEEIESIILSGDLDTLQLVDTNTKVFTSRKGLKDTILYDEKAVKERYGLSPIQIPDLKGLMGDVSDNIPGVKGIGVKTAAGLLQRFGSLEGIYEVIEKGIQKEEKKSSTPEVGEESANPSTGSGETSSSFASPTPGVLEDLTPGVLPAEESEGSIEESLTPGVFPSESKTDSSSSTPRVFEESFPGVSVKPRIKKMLLENKEQAFFSRMLAQVKQDVDISFDIDKCVWKGFDRPQAIQALRVFEFNTLINRLPIKKAQQDRLF